MVRPVISAVSNFPSSLTFAPFASSLPFAPHNLPPPLPSPPIPPPPDPPDLSILPPCRIPTLDRPIEIPNDKSKRWSSLFQSKPKNAGLYAPPKMQLEFKGNVMIPSSVILQEAKEQWQNYLVGFFLDTPLNYYAVTNHLQRLWKPQGGIKIKFNGSMFFFLLSNSEDRTRIIQVDPVVIHDKLFIIKPWDINIGSDASLIRNVPVWIKMRNIPLYCWTKIGISWLAMRVGKFLCMDNSTESLERMEFAKCMVEVTPDEPLVNDFQVELPGGGEQTVTVHYLWQPAACVICKCFGHETEQCKKKKDAERQRIDNQKQKSSNTELNANSLSRDGKAGRNSEVLAGISEGRNGIHIRRNEVWRKVPNKNKMNSNTMFRKPIHGKVDKQSISTKVRSGKVLYAKNSFRVLENIEKDGDDRIAEHYTVREDTLEDGEIEMVDALLTKAFGGPSAGNSEVQDHLNDVMGEASLDQSDYGTGNIVSDVATRDDEATPTGDNVNNVSVKSLCVNNENLTGVTNVINGAKGLVEGETVQHGMNIMKVNKVLEATAVRDEVNVNSQEIQSLQTVKNVQNIDYTVLKQSISEDMRVIAGKLQTELEGRVFNSKQYYVTKKTVQDFSDFKLRNDLETMDTTRLEGVSDLVKQMLISVNNRGKTTPIGKGNNPYAHLAAPPAYKERPPDLVIEPVASSSNEKARSHTPITRSRQKEMLRNLQENG